MPDGFSNPIAGGSGALIRPALKSPNYATGSTGWSINKDGTAEFNGVTVRGTIILGSGSTNTIILDNTRDAIFVYDNAGNLMFSISPNAGTDSLGNPYVPGAVSYLQGTPAKYVQLVQSVLQMHNGDANLALLFEMLISPANSGPGNNQPYAQLRAPANDLSGTAELFVYGSSTGGAAPFIGSASSAGTDMDWLHQGVIKYWQPGGWAETWHRVNATGGAAPAFNVNWSNTGGAFGNVSYMKTADGAVKLAGVCQYSGAAAAPQTIFTLPAGYRPNRDVPMEVTAIGSDGAFQASEVLVIRSTGAVVLTSWTGTGIITPITLERCEFPLTV